MNRAIGELNRVPQAAGKCNVANKTFWNWIAQGRVGVVRLGRSVRIPQSEIDRIIEEGYTPAHNQ